MSRHARIDRATNAAGLGCGASELHGSLVGMLLGGGRVTRDRWQQALLLEPLPEPAGEPGATLEIEGLVDQTLTVQTNPDGMHTPLLPDADGGGLDDRARALIDWCAGFLGGYGIAGASPSAGTPAAEALDAIARIAGTRLPAPGLPPEEASSLEQISGFLDEALATLSLATPVRH